VSYVSVIFLRLYYCKCKYRILHIVEVVFLTYHNTRVSVIGVIDTLLRCK